MLSHSKRIYQSLLNQGQINQQATNNVIFKKTFVREYVRFGNYVRSMAQGESGYSNSWKDWFITGGISSGVVITNGILGLLTGLGILAAPLTGGLSIAISVVGVVLGIGYNVYRYKKNLRESRQADSLMKHENLKSEGEKIADHLATVYAKELATCSQKEAASLAKASCNIVTQSLKKGTVQKIKEFFSFTSLKNTFMRWLGIAPKKNNIREKIQTAFMNYQSSINNNPISSASKNSQLSLEKNAYTKTLSNTKLGSSSLFAMKNLSSPVNDSELEEEINPLRIANH